MYSTGRRRRAGTISSFFLIQCCFRRRCFAWFFLVTLCCEFYVRCRVLIENSILFDMIENSWSDQCGNVAFFNYTKGTKTNWSFLPSGYNDGRLFLTTIIHTGRMLEATVVLLWQRLWCTQLSVKTECATDVTGWKESILCLCFCS